MKFKKLLTITFILLLYNSNVNATISLIRDTQTERFIRKISTPIFFDANLNPESIKIYIINDDNINAFVSSGQNLFLNSGLITLSDDILGLVGVIAHETGHIAGGHIARISSEGQDLQRNYAIGFILGIGAALAGSAEAAQAIILGNMQIAQRSILSYTRSHEEAADEAAIRYLHALNVSAAGLLEFFEKIQEIEKINTSSNNPYVRTHPLTRSRIDRMEQIVQMEENMDLSNSYINASIKKEFAFVKAKLEAFLADNPEALLAELNEKEELLFNQKYMKAVLMHRMGNSLKAIEIMDELIREDVSDPYLVETKAQIYYENGQLDQAAIIYENLIQVLDSALIRVQYASAINYANEKVFYNLAIKQLNYVLIEEPDNVIAWDLLAELYGKNGYEALANYAQGESYYLTGEYDLAITKAKLALNALKEDLTYDLSRNQQIRKVEDLVFFATQAQKEKK